MSRLLLLIAIVVVTYLLLKSYRRQEGKRGGYEHEEDMVRCTHCGVHVPKGESVMDGGNYYCSEAHLRAYQVSSRKPDAK